MKAVAIANRCYITRASNTGWVRKLCDFRPISRYITETVRDRGIVTIGDSVVYVLNNDSYFKLSYRWWKSTKLYGIYHEL